MKLTVVALAFVCINSFTFAQKADDIKESREWARESRRDAANQKMNAQNTAQSAFNDTASFGKDAKFLGSLYAGTVYVFNSCDPTDLAAEGIVLAADDHCVVHSGGQSPTSAEIFDPAWQITIPGKSADNVIYPMMNNGVGYDLYSSVLSIPVSIFYTPRLTIESAALNDPAAIDPNTGSPMNGSFTTSLAGSRVRAMEYTAGQFTSDYDNYASVSGRGLSRGYFQAIGLPANVINELFKRPMTLKFGIRIRAQGPVYLGQFYYTVRLLGN